MAIIKIPLSSQCISNEVIDDNQLCMYNSAGRRPLMGGNWKLNPRSVAAATKLAEDVSYCHYCNYNDSIIVSSVNICYISFEICALYVRKSLIVEF